RRCASAPITRRWLRSLWRNGAAGSGHPPTSTPSLHTAPAERRDREGEAMTFSHTTGVKPTPSSIELGRGADGVVVEVLDHPELVIKDMNHPFKLGRNRVVLELRVLHAVVEATAGLGATRVSNHGTDEQERSWLVRERVFDVQPRGTQAARNILIETILRI